MNTSVNFTVCGINISTDLEHIQDSNESCFLIGDENGDIVTQIELYYDGYILVVLDDGEKEKRIRKDYSIDEIKMFKTFFSEIGTKLEEFINNRDEDAMDLDSD